MVLEWNDITKTWDEWSDEISLEMGKLWLNVLDGVACLRNVGARFYYNSDEDGSTAGLVVDQHHQAWITWGEVEDDT